MMKFKNWFKLIKDDPKNKEYLEKVSEKPMIINKLAKLKINKSFVVPRNFEIVIFSRGMTIDLESQLNLFC